MSGDAWEPSADMSWRLLQQAARLLLEYNERSALIKAHLHRLASCLRVPVSIAVAYREVTLATPDGRMCRVGSPELRVNTAVSIDTLRTIDDLCTRRVDLAEGGRRFEAIERASPRHHRGVVVALFGLAAAALAAMLNADWAAMGASGVSAAVGLMARQQVAKAARTPLLPPFTAALAGALVAGVIVRADWTATPNLCLVVPALMLVPGPHLINSVEDMLENEMEAGIARLCLAVALLLAVALGVVAGGSLVVGAITEAASGGGPVATVALVDIALAGVAAAGFSVFQNSPWRVVWLSIACGAFGYAIRAVSLAAGSGLVMGSLAACLAIGITAGLAADRLRLPFAAVAFASAAPLMPGVAIYRSIAGAMRLTAAKGTADPALAVAMLAPLLEAAFVVAAMVVGLVVGARFAGLARWSRSQRARLSTTVG